MELRAREARARGKQPRRVQHWVSYRGISPSLTRAVLVAEDAAFWQHEGVDLDELQKSIELDWARGQLLRGASTITQQLAKNLYLSPSRIPTRKLTELYITRRLEHELSKTRIFDLYLNNIEWGDGIWGAEAAAQAYFNIPASAVNPDQAALMAGAIINPRLLNIAKPNGRLRARQRLIRARMGYVTPPPIVAVPPPADSPAPVQSAPEEPEAEPTPPPEETEPEPAPSEPSTTSPVAEPSPESKN